MRANATLPGMVKENKLALELAAAEAIGDDYADGVAAALRWAQDPHAAPAPMSAAPARGEAATEPKPKPKATAKATKAPSPA